MRFTEPFFRPHAARKHINYPKCMQRPSSRSYKLSYLAYVYSDFYKVSKAFDKVSRVQTQPPTQQHV